MVKRYGLVLLTLVVITSFFAPYSEAQTPQVDPIEIHLWHAYTGEQQTVLDELIVQFNAENWVRLPCCYACNK